MANIKNSNQNSTEVTITFKKRNWTLALMDKVLNRNPLAKEVVIETTCLHSFAEKQIKGSLDTVATLVEDGVISGFYCGKPHQVEKPVYEDGKKIGTTKKTAFFIKVFDLDITKVNTRKEYDEKGDVIGEKEFRWFNSVYKNMIEQSEFEKQLECVDVNCVVDEV